MSFTPTYEILMRELGAEPYECQKLGCVHVSGGFWRMMLHFQFGHHHKH